jgi:hypothetical protein
VKKRNHKDDDDDDNDDDDDDNDANGKKADTTGTRGRSDWSPKRCKTELGFANGYLSRSYKRWRSMCLGRAYSLGVTDKKMAGADLWGHLETYARGCDGFQWSSSGAKYINDTTTLDCMVELQKAVADLLKDVLKKARAQETACIKEACAAGVNIETAGIKQVRPRKKKPRKFYPLAYVLQLLIHLQCLGVIIRTNPPRTQVTIRVIIFDPDITVPGFTSASSDDSYFWGIHPIAVAVGRL